MNDEQKREANRKLIMEKQKEGKVVFMTIEGAMVADIEDFLSQPYEGILYDLNRLPECLDEKDPRWVNDMATIYIIKKLKESYDERREDVSNKPDEA